MTYKLRLGGTNKFVSDIDPYYNLCRPIGKVDFVEGWDNLNALIFPTKVLAERAKETVWDIEGFHTSIEEIKS
jgi:hypothetical protein|tara:strand:+ start:980 stop:1198 length:219 start_codon:yes stop_codon:yes gene_type:complete